MRPARFEALAIAALAATLAAVTLPGAIAAFIRLPAEPIIARAVAGRALSVTEAEAAVATLSPARAVSPAATRDTALVLMAERPDTGEQAASPQERAAQAATLLEAYLAAVPSDTLAWETLARARAVTGDRRAAVAALKLSIATGYWDPRVLLDRVIVGTGLIDALDAETRATLGQLAAEALRRHPDDFVRLVDATGRTPVVFALLAAEPEAFAAFQDWSRRCIGHPQCR